MKFLRLLPALALCAYSYQTSAQTTKAEVPDWALPGSPTHKQVPPPPDFHRPARTENKPIGIFKGQSDIGAALVPGASSYNAATGQGQYKITSAGYNVWYTRDELRFVWKKMSGDVSLAADISFPDTAGYGDRKALVIIRQSLDDDSKEAMVALHGAGLIHLAWRPENNQMMKEVRVNRRNGHTGSNPADSLDIGLAKRIGIEKRGDDFAVFVSMHGEPMHQVGAPIQLHINGPFYVGLGFCSHLPDKADAAVLSNVILENAAGQVR
jgi:hypothetical protein